MHIAPIFSLPQAHALYANAPVRFSGDDPKPTWELKGADAIRTAFTRLKRQQPQDSQVFLIEDEDQRKVVMELQLNKGHDKIGIKLCYYLPDDDESTEQQPHIAKDETYTLNADNQLEDTYRTEGFTASFHNTNYPSLSRHPEKIRYLERVIDRIVQGSHIAPLGKFASYSFDEALSDTQTTMPVADLFQTMD